jgi:hypothetical protein
MEVSNVDVFVMSIMPIFVLVVSLLLQKADKKFTHSVVMGFAFLFFTNTFTTGIILEQGLAYFLIFTFIDFIAIIFIMIAETKEHKYTLWPIFSLLIIFPLVIQYLFVLSKIFELRLFYPLF